MSAVRRVLYWAPGSGLGHLVRALSACYCLKQKKIEFTIASDSPFLKGIQNYTNISVLNITDLSSAVDGVTDFNPDLLICDTFPWGIQGELWGLRHEKFLMIYMARRL